MLYFTLHGIIFSKKIKYAMRIAEQQESIFIFQLKKKQNPLNITSSSCASVSLSSLFPFSSIHHVSSFPYLFSSSAPLVLVSSSPSLIFHTLSLPLPSSLSPFALLSFSSLSPSILPWLLLC